MPPMTPSLVLATAALWVALLHLVLARWRDLGPFTVGLAGCAVLLGLPAPAEPVLATVAGALLVQSIAWARGGARGVGRPGLTGLTLGVAVAAVPLVALIAPRVVVPAETVRQAAAAAVGLLAVLTGGLAIQRPRHGLPLPRWTGVIPVRGPRPPSLSEPAPQAEATPEASAPPPSA